MLNEQMQMMIHLQNKMALTFLKLSENNLLLKLKNSLTKLLLG